TADADGAAAKQAPQAARTRRPEKPANEVPPSVRQEPPQTLARALDLRPHRRRRANQQPRRTRPPRRHHLPQALPRQPIRPRRTQHRATALHLHTLPPATTLPLRLPHRRPHRQHPRRPHPRTRLTAAEPERLRFLFHRSVAQRLELAAVALELLAFGR